MNTKTLTLAVIATMATALNLGTSDSVAEVEGTECDQYTGCGGSNHVDIDIKFNVTVGDEEDEAAADADGDHTHSHSHADDHTHPTAEEIAAAEAEAAAAAQAAAEAAAQEQADEVERLAAIASAAAAEAALAANAADLALTAAEAQEQAEAAQAAANVAQDAADDAAAAAAASEAADDMNMADAAALDAAAAQASADAAAQLAMDAAGHAEFEEARDCPPQEMAWTACNAEITGDPEIAQCEADNEVLLQQILDDGDTATVAMAGGDIDVLRASLLDDMRYLISGGQATWTVIDDESNPACVDQIVLVDECPSIDTFQAATTAAIQANNEVKNFKQYLRNYECEATKNLLSTQTALINSAVEDAEAMRDMQILLLKNVESNEDDLATFTAEVEARYAAAVLSGCYVDVWPADFSIPMADDDLPETCDLGTLEADLMTAAADLDMDARTAAFNLGQFAFAETQASCSD